LLAVTWFINLFNFMDGIDGIAGSETVFVAGAGAFLSWLSGVDAGWVAVMMGFEAACVGF
jgi:Fuc2NAc and GlcNAc transferase